MVFPGRVLYSADNLFEGLVGCFDKTSFPSTEIMHEMTHRMTEESLKRGKGFYFSDGGDALVADFFTVFGCTGEHDDVFTGVCTWELDTESMYRPSFASLGSSRTDIKNTPSGRPRRGWLRRCLGKRWHT